VALPRRPGLSRIDEVEIMVKKLLLFALWLCSWPVIAQPMFPSLKPCGSADGNCALVLDSNNFLAEASSGKRLSETAEPVGSMNRFELYRDGDRYVLESENYSQAKSRRWLVFAYDSGKVVLDGAYIFSIDVDPNTGSYWHGYDCRGVAMPFALPAKDSFSDAALEALCGDAEGFVVSGQGPSMPLVAKGLIINVPVYKARIRHGSATYLFAGSEEPDLASLACLANCVSSASAGAKSAASSASTASANASESCKPDSITTPDLITCGQQSLERVDAVLNEQYKKSLAVVAPADKKRLADVQRKWVRFKESYCEGIYQSALPGAEAPIEKLACLVGTTNSRLGELIYLQTGLTNDGFYKAASLTAGPDRASGLKASMNRLAGEEVDDPVWKRYADCNCDMSARLFREDVAYCVLRMRFQLPVNR
jgi:uncharacterized protein YecT (DUF1311 family)